MASVQFGSSEGQQAGQPAPQEQANTTQAALTPDEIAAQVEKAVAKAFRALQSSQSKQEQRIKDFVQQQVNGLKQSGVEVTPDMERTITRTVKEQFAESEPEETQTQPPAQAVKTEAPKARSQDPSEAWAIEQGEIYDCPPLEDGDPEAEALKGAASLKEWKRLVAEGTRAKATRLAANPPQASQTKSVPAAANANGPASSLMDQYRAELAKVRPGDIDAIYRVKGKYQKLGLKI